MNRILITCPNFIHTIQFFHEELNKHNLTYTIPELKQNLSEQELINIIADYDGWIAGDDPATWKVIEKGAKGKLKALVKWGVGVDNIDQKACQLFNIKFSNTPAMFSHEVADIALGYLLNMCRELHHINHWVRKGIWYKPLGITLCSKKALIIGYGNIGKEIYKRLKAFGVLVYVYDPLYTQDNHDPFCVKDFHDLALFDFIILSCSLVEQTYHLVNDSFLSKVNPNVIIINVSRGSIVCTESLLTALSKQRIKGYASDVFEEEPLPSNSPLFLFDNVMVGSHNGSNTKEGVYKTNHKAIQLMSQFLQS